jgi:hypothetical protein
LGLFGIDRVNHVVIWGQFITGIPFQPLSLEEITKAGEEFYVDNLKEKLEKENMGQYG